MTESTDFRRSRCYCKTHIKQSKEKEMRAIYYSPYKLSRRFLWMFRHLMDSRLFYDQEQHPRTRLTSGRPQEDHTNSTYQLHCPATNSIQKNCTRVGILTVATIYLQLIKIDTCFEVLLSFNVVTSIVYIPLPAMWKS